jgi:DTW domain-containing protein YfiP
MTESSQRPTCARCRRPTAFCYCASLPSLTTATNVVFVQHPKERDKAIGTARMAHLSLPGSTLVEGIEVDEHPQVAPLLGRDDVAVLFPGASARPVTEWGARPPTTMIVVDGTWWQAKRVMERSPRLASLPRMSIDAPAPSTYRIRKPPSDQHLSTVEAVALALGVLEDAPDKFATMRRPFDVMVERQLEAQQRRVARVRKRPKRLTPPLRELEVLRDAPERGVVVYAEANAHSRAERAPGEPELLQLVARWPVTGQSFEAILRPRRPLGQHVPDRLGVAADVFETGEEVRSFLHRWREHLAPGGVLCAWGSFPRDLLAREEGARRDFIDLRALTARCLGGAAGGIERGASRLCGVSPPALPRRADNMLVLIADVYDELVRRARAAR